MKDYLSQLKAVSVSEPETIIHALDLLHYHFSPEDYCFSSSNKIMKLGEQLAKINLDLREKLRFLNSAFYTKENFLISDEHDSPVFLKHFFDKKEANSYLASLVYQYLLIKMNIKSELWCEKRPYLIKITHSEKSFVVNLENYGARADGKDLQTPPEENQNTQIKDQFYYLLSKIADHLLLKSQPENTLKVYDCIISLYPEKIFWFARRGLLQKTLGHFSLALSDLTKYEDFVNQKEIPQTVTQALIELKGLSHNGDLPSISIH